MDNLYYLVRHGATKYNEQGRFIGITDLPLSKNGVEQALLLHNKLKDLPFDVAYSSHLLRAYDTARIALGWVVPEFNKDGSYILTSVGQGDISRKIPLIIIPALAERMFGELEGKLRKDYPELYKNYDGRDIPASFDYKPEGGESFADKEGTIKSFLEKLYETYTSQKIIIFAHNSSLTLIIKNLRGISNEEALKLKIDYCELIGEPENYVKDKSFTPT